MIRDLLKTKQLSRLLQNKNLDSCICHLEKLDLGRAKQAVSYESLKLGFS